MQPIYRMAPKGMKGSRHRLKAPWIIPPGVGAFAFALRSAGSGWLELSPLRLARHTYGRWPTQASFSNFMPDSLDFMVTMLGSTLRTRNWS
eukprot:1881149-Amphidinium_carterae.1